MKLYVGRILRLAGSVGAALALLVLGAPPGAAHAAYKDSNPANRSTVSAPPSEVWAEFTEPVTEDSNLAIYDPCGTQVDNRDSWVTGYRISISMSGDKAGVYRVTFAVVSTLDGHPTRGEFSFTSSGGEPCPGADDQTDSTADSGSSGGGDRRAPAPRGRGTGSASAQASAAGDAGAPEERGARQRKRAGKDRAQRGAARADEQGRRNRNPESDEVLDGDLVAAASEGGAPEDIPVSGLLVSFGLAALIGAVGGQVYAGIVGPRRKK